ncbi:protein-disulfide reductase DsbD family protein [Algiphilus sp.]|uniref:protein-disulfide reductase DsbD family protein n=1 Tax=Algiphilus sp. TaxID=1872431 RepID=UPI003C5F6A1E
MMLRTLLALLLIPAAGTAAAASSGWSQHDHLRVALVSETTHIQPGTPFRVALRMQPETHWHTYWRNPGDSGIETRFDWTLPDGFSAAPIDWPYPERLPIEPLVNYGYSGEHALPVTVTPPADLPTGEPVTLTLDASWLVCKVECIPGEATLTLRMPVRDRAPEAAAEQAAMFAWADARQPVPRDRAARFATDGGHLSLQVPMPEAPNVEALAVFPAQPELVDHAAAASLRHDAGQLQLSQPLSDYFAGADARVEFVIVDTAAGEAVSVIAEHGELSTGAATAGAGDSGRPALGWILLLALGGGALLNLMPCVFPVLSLKALHIVEGGGHQRAQALAYTAGVLVAFGVVAGALLAVRSAGAAVGWGFQLQSPAFIAILAYLLFAMGLSLSGLVHFGTGWMGAGQKLTERGGLAGSFFTGVLACVVASPCTAPFMGTALGFAVTQPPAIALGIFLALGLGMAAPMLLIGFLPGLARVLPKPGAWMEAFKQAMAFPLYLTVVWLLWVLARQTAPNGLAAVMTGLVLLAFALWLWGRGQGRPARWLRGATVAAAVVAALALVALPAAPGTATAARTADAWQPWQPGRVAALRDEGRGVFVNMTADWCVTCLVNERVALSTDTVRAHMRDNDIVYLKGDWTRRDAAITEYLARFDRNGVPLYVYYPSDPDAEPTVLPQILTPDIVVRNLQ